MSNNSAAALEHFLTTKFRTTVPKNNCTSLNDPCDHPVNWNRDGTLTFQTFRPRDYPYSTDTNQSPVCSSRSIHSPPFEPNAYRPTAAYYQNIFLNNAGHFPRKQRQVTAMNGYKNGYYSSSQPRSSVPNYDYSYCTDEIFSDLPTNSRRLYTYVEDQVVIRVNQNNERVGFSMSGGADENLQSVVNSVLPGTPADRAGLMVGDEIVEVNKIPVEGKEHAEIVKLIHKCIKSRVIQLRVRRKHDLRSPDTLSGSPEVKVSDAYLVSVDKNHSNEVARKLERNYPGIRTHDMEVVASSSGNRTSEVAVPPSSYTETSLQFPQATSSFDIDDSINKTSPTGDHQRERLKKYEKELKKRKELDERRAREQAFLRASLRGSKKLQSLENSNRRKLEVPSLQNENPDTAGYSNKCYVTSDLSYQENLGNLQNETIQLEQVIQSANRVANHLENNEKRDEESKLIRDYFTQPDVQKAIEATALQQNTFALSQKASSSSSLTDFGKAELQGNLKIVKFHKCDDTYLGATVRNEGEKVIIGRIIKGGVADKSHLLREGDELIEANGHDLRSRSVAEVCDILRSISGELTLIVAPSKQTSTDDIGESPMVYQHMRALFDYDPEDDYYVPCKELALKFQRGDILHVINMSDENWWQAYRDGDDPSSSLAGLIPSTAFQRQVILYNRELERENELEAKRKDLFGCAKKKASKSKANTSNDFFNSADEVIGDESELLTYESVSLYLSKSGRKRPIVLCGPERVGCLELRQRLVESDKDKYASAVPYTTRPKMPGEVDGIHFHFVTKQKFQEDAKAGKFIEYGEFQKHLYGTSIAAIQAVVDRAKICLLTLKAENLKALRKTSLMPFVIFIAPPSLQQLRRQKELLGQHGIQDDQLKQILHEGKLMEQEYGHLFDRIMVNIDLDRSLAELKETVHRLETEPQWVPSFWVSGNSSIAIR